MNDDQGLARPSLLNADLSYGSDHTGLICGYLFAPDQAGQSIHTAAAATWLNASATGNSPDFLWLHFNLTNVNAEKWLIDHLALPQHYFETMREGPASTRIEQAEDSLIAVINDLVYEFSYDTTQTATLWMCVSHKVVVSARLHPLRSVDRLQVSVKAGEQIASPVALLAQLLRGQADVLQQIARHATTQVDQIEDKLLAGQGDTNRSKLGSLRRVFVRLRRLLAPEPGALFRLLNRPPSWFDEEDAQELRAATEEFSAVLSDLAALQERIKLLQEEIAAYITEQTNRSLFLLTMVTVMALPINIIAGLLGMNVGGIPLANHTYGFWIIAGIVVTFTSAVGWYAFSRRRDTRFSP